MKIVDLKTYIVCHNNTKRTIYPPVISTLLLKS
jgi:hypothetical protein